MKFLVLGILGSIAFVASSPAVCAQDTTSVSPKTLFSSHDVLHLTLEADFDQLRRDRSQDTEDRPGRISFVQPDGSRRTVEVGVKTRGITRLQRTVCNFPPLRLNFRTRDAVGTVFAGQDKLKLVVHCQDHREEYEQYVLREYLAYRIYALLTPFSFRVRLVHMAYVKPAENDTITKYGFLIEADDEMAGRNGGSILEREGVRQAETDEGQGTLFSVFQYLIGNVDWKVSGLHNVKLVLRDGDPIPVAVPYDFDYSGAVNTEYAEPDRGLGLQSVRQRMFISPCRTEYDLSRALALFRDHKDAIYRLYSELEGMSESSVRGSLEYFDEFYSVLERPEATRRVFVRSCPIG
jgi:hypothetical protein